MSSVKKDDICASGVELDLVCDLCLNKEVMLRWEDTDFNRTSVCLKQLWSTPQVLDLALARRFVLTVCACSRCMARSRCSRACSHGRRLPSASSFQLAVGAPFGTHSTEACCFQRGFPPH